MLLSKKVLIKRINPPKLRSIGDLAFQDDFILVSYRWKIIKHTLQQIERIKAYSLTSWGLVDYEQVDIKFANNFRIKLDGSLSEHREFIEAVMEQLGQNSKTLNWDFLPQLGDNMGRDIIFERTTSANKNIKSNGA